MPYQITQGPRPISNTERNAGKRAPFHVFYKHGDKLKFEAIWAETPEKAAETLLAFAGELRMRRVQVVRVHTITGEA